MWSTDSRIEERSTASRMQVKRSKAVERVQEKKERESMAEYKLGEIEMKFATLIWENEPISSGELAKLAERTLSWKKSTTYTILKRVCERELFQNVNGIVTSLVSKQEFLAKQSEQFVEETFKGSLPSFVAAFCSQKKLSKAEIAELRKIIEENE